MRTLLQKVDTWDYYIVIGTNLSLQKPCAMIKTIIYFLLDKIQSQNSINSDSYHDRDHDTYVRDKDLNRHAYEPLNLPLIFP